MRHTLRLLFVGAALGMAIPWPARAWQWWAFDVPLMIVYLLLEDPS